MHTNLLGTRRLHHVSNCCRICSLVVRAAPTCLCLAQTLCACSSALPCLQAAPQPGGNPLNVQRGAITLVDAAVNPRNLCRLDPTWAPWY